MNLESECLECLLNQAGKVAKNFNLEGGIELKGVLGYRPLGIVGLILLRLKVPTSILLVPGAIFQNLGGFFGGKRRTLFLRTFKKGVST